MSRSGWNKDPRGLVAEIAAKGAGGSRIVQDVLEDVGEEMEWEMQQYIHTVPSGLSPGKIGRVMTEHMVNSVARTQVKKTGKVSTIEIGWPFVQEDYFIYQETGKDPNGKRKNIPPMLALTHIYLKGRNRIIEELDRLRNI